MNMKKDTIAKYILEIVLIIILSLIYYLNQYISVPKVLYIPQGSINGIISQLAYKNYNVSKVDSILLRVLGSPQSGWINIGTTKLTKGDFLYKLTTAKAAMRTITLIPGETTYIFLNQLANNLDLDRNKLQNIYESLTDKKEGVFVPNTYVIPLGITEEELIKLLIEKSQEQMKSLSIKFFGIYDEKKWFKYVSIASIIQKESANKKEMPIVSSVIYNRVKKGMKLQMDGTLNYGKYSHIKVTSKRIKNDTSLYNTYKYKGVPATPICTVSSEAIKAAIFPAKTSYLYFMKSKSGTHDFTSNYSTHLHNIRRATK
jgi:UPF0755 protein